MRCAIDSVKAISNCGLVVTGWTEAGDIALMVGDLLLEGAALKVDRPDLQAIFGGGASSWGFTTLFLTPSPAVISGSTRLVLTKNGTVLRTLNAGDLPLKQSAGENHSHQAFKAAVAAANTGSVIEIGSRARSGNVRRNWFPAHFDYLGIDIAEGPNVDLVADAHDLPAELTDRFDFALSLSTFEHLLMPWKAVLELNKVMKTGGLAYVQSHASWPIHEEPWDFFRFSKYAWNGLFNEHTGFELIHADHCGRAFITPEFVVEEPMRGLADHPTYLISACLARKIAPARVSWAANASEVTNLAYDHR